MTTIRRLFSGLIGIWESEPVAVTGLITVVLDAALAFGVPVTPDQKTALIGVVTALGVIVAREKVTPVAAPTLPAGTEVTVVTPGPTPNQQVVV